MDIRKTITELEKINEGHLSDVAPQVDTDHEVNMARNDLYKAANYAVDLHRMLKNVSEYEGLDGWVQSKITKASDYLSSVFHYMEGNAVPDEADLALVVSADEDTNEEMSPEFKNYNQAYNKALQNANKSFQTNPTSKNRQIHVSREMMKFKKDYAASKGVKGNFRINKGVVTQEALSSKGRDNLAKMISDFERMAEEMNLSDEALDSIAMHLDQIMADVQEIEGVREDNINEEHTPRHRTLIEIDNLNTQLKRKIDQLIKADDGDLTDQITTMANITDRLDAVMKRSFKIIPELNEKVKMKLVKDKDLPNLKYAVAKKQGKIINKKTEDTIKPTGPQSSGGKKYAKPDAPAKPQDAPAPKPRPEPMDADKTVSLDPEFSKKVADQNKKNMKLKNSKFSDWSKK